MSVNSSVAITQSVALSGFNGDVIDVETDMKAGLPSVQIVGMGNKAIDEARQRVRSAIANSLLQFPPRKFTINLAPAELPKDGTHFDLPIALSILVASGQIKQRETHGALFAGELALDGRIKSIRGAVVIAEATRHVGASRLYVPIANVSQARLVTGIEVIGVETLQELFQHLRGFKKISTHTSPSSTQTNNYHPPTPLQPPSGPTYPTLDDIAGHEQAKRALLIAATGRHNLLFNGPPGTGKTLLARSLTGLLPPLTDDEVIEVTKLHSLIQNSECIQTKPPFRTPHHTITLTALIGGGLRPKPGEVSLAHKGVLFLDELPEYPRSTLEALRQPLEDRTVHLSRHFGRISYPADVLLIATMNPCPCGFFGDSSTPCTCTMTQIASYQKRLSGPLLDRIDLRLTVNKVSPTKYLQNKPLQSSQQLTAIESVKMGRNSQYNRYNRSNFYNGYASLQQARQLFHITTNAWHLLTKAADSLALSNRGFLRTLRVARTIADIETSHDLDSAHIAEALQFRTSNS